MFTLRITQDKNKILKEQINSDQEKRDVYTKELIYGLAVRGEQGYSIRQPRRAKY